MSDHQSAPLEIPDDPEVSKLRLYSMGVAASNKELESMELQVVPTEVLNLLDGEVISLPFDSTVTGVRANGTEYSTKVVLDTALNCLWLPYGSNRDTAPDVRRGERVLIFRYADTDQFYWKELGWDDHLRRGETVRYRFSATVDENADMDDPNNWYTIYVSTHLGMIEINTTDANKELSRYRFQLNTKDGVFLIKDSHGNFIQLESVIKAISMQNGDGTLFQAAQKTFYAYAPDTLSLEGGKTMTLETLQLYLKAQKINLAADDSIDLATETLSVQLATLNLNAAVANVKVGTTNWEGNFNLKGNFGLNGNMSNTSGNQATWAGPVTFQQKVTANGIESTATIKGPTGSI